MRMDFFTWFMLLKKCLAHDKYRSNSKHTLIAVNYVAFHLQHLLHSSTGTIYLNLDVIYTLQ